MILAIDQSALNSLPLDSLVQRMDEVLRQSVIERYGECHDSYPLNLVSEIIGTHKVRLLSPEIQRHLAHIAFSYLVQLELGSVCGGISNTMLFDGRYSEEHSWRSPAFRLRHGAIHQYQIISSRIAMEVFMDILYCIQKGSRLEKKRSKLKAFREFLCDSQNEFHYFAHVLLAAYRFDRGIRTPEVHGTSRLPKRLLLLQTPSQDELNEAHRLTNTLINCWRPLVELLNGLKPNCMHIGSQDQAWFDAYMKGTEQDVVDRLELMFEGSE